MRCRMASFVHHQAVQQWAIASTAACRQPKRPDGHVMKNSDVSPAWLWAHGPGDAESPWNYRSQRRASSGSRSSLTIKVVRGTAASQLGNSGLSGPAGRAGWLGCWSVVRRTSDGRDFPWRPSVDSAWVMARMWSSSSSSRCVRIVSYAYDECRKRSAWLQQKLTAEV